MLNDTIQSFFIIVLTVRRLYERLVMDKFKYFGTKFNGTYSSNNLIRAIGYSNFVISGTWNIGINILSQPVICSKDLESIICGSKVVHAIKICQFTFFMPRGNGAEMQGFSRRFLQKSRRWTRKQAAGCLSCKRVSA